MKTLFSLVLAVWSCTPLPPPEPPDPAPTPGPEPSPSPVPADDRCSRACARLTLLAQVSESGCDAARPTEAGASCEDVCRHVLEQGTVLVDTDCILRAQTCAEADDC